MAQSDLGHSLAARAGLSRRAALPLACLTAGIAWIVAEVGGGLTFLALGVRLWRYEICPLFDAITSPVIWALAVALIIPLSLGFDRAVANRFRGAAKFGTQLAFVMTTGSVLEVLINEFFFRGCLGRPLYEYLVLPTFAGSGSLLSPFYYSTLLIHIPITDRLLGGPRSEGSADPPSPCRPQRHRRASVE